MPERCAAASTGGHSAIRGHIDRWLSDLRLVPRLMGEFDDGALMKAFGQAGAGFFPGPAVLRMKYAHATIRAASAWSMRFMRGSGP